MEDKGDCTGSRTQNTQSSRNRKSKCSEYKTAVNKEYESRIEGLKSSIISVYGDAIDKIGFSITEKANRSAQTRLGKTLKSLEKMESKEDIVYRKQKYEMQIQLEKLLKQKVDIRREQMKRTSSLDDLYGVDTREGQTSRNNSCARLSRSHRSSPKSFRLLEQGSASISFDEFNCKVLQSNQEASKLASKLLKDRLQIERRRSGSFSGQFIPPPVPDQRARSESFHIYDGASKHCAEQFLMQDLSERENSFGSKRSISSAGVHTAAAVDIPRPATCSAQNQDSSPDLLQVIDGEARVNRRSMKPSSIFPKLQNKPHYLVHKSTNSKIQQASHSNREDLQQVSSRRSRRMIDLQMSRTPEPPRKKSVGKLKICGSENGSDSSDNDYNCKISVMKAGTKLSANDHSSGEDWLPPTKHEMLQELAQQNAILQYKVNAFLAKQNPY